MKNIIKIKGNGHVIIKNNMIIGRLIEKNGYFIAFKENEEIYCDPIRKKKLPISSTSNMNLVTILVEGNVILDLYGGMRKIHLSLKNNSYVKVYGTYDSLSVETEGNSICDKSNLRDIKYRDNGIVNGNNCCMIIF